MDKKRKVLFLCSLCLAILFAGCGGSSPEVYPQQSDAAQSGDSGFILAGPGSYDSADTAVVVKINKEEGTITLLNLVVSKNYTLNYDSTTVFTDKYGQPLTLDQIAEGDIVDVNFLKSKKRLASLALSSESWVSENISRYQFDATAHNVTIGTSTYKITEDTKIFSNGKEVDLMDINNVDVLKFQGIDSTVYSIVVDKGHGYLRLSGDAAFIGGWIEVGGTIIRPITEDMLLTVPEGSYQVSVSTKGGSGTKNVVIRRNEESLVDVGDIELEETLYGQVIFSLTPSSAKLYVDGSLVNTNAPVILEYGIHQLIARAEGFDTITSYLKVAEESAAINIELEETANNDDDEDEVTVSGSNAITSYYQVHIDAPEGVEVYLDGNYVGVSPVSFRKAAGEHVITLRLSGYETRSYTIQVDEEDRDISYSFAELVLSTQG